MRVAFSLFFEGSQEEPPTGSTASGTGRVTYDTVTDVAKFVWDVTGVDFGPDQGLPPATPSPLDDVTGYHFHDNVRGENAPVVFDIQANDEDLDVVPRDGNSWTVSGSWEPTEVSRLPITDFEAAIAAATPGTEVGLYANIHTMQFPTGEIRAQWVASADDNANTVTGTDLSEHLAGLGGDDQLNGKEGDDSIRGGDGADAITGGAGLDLIRGGDGADTITGGAGLDRMQGGAGADRFVLTSAEDSFGDTRDRVGDFEQGVDQIDLRLIDADPVQADDQAFVFLGTAAFTGVAGELRFGEVNGNTKVSADLDGDARADFQIRLDGLITLTDADFLL
jgi:serralysin